MKKYNIEPYDDNQSKYNFEKEDAYLRAKKKLDKLVGFYWHLAVYVVINIFLIVLISSNTEQGLWHFGTWATPLFWGIGLLFHFLGVFGPNFMFGKNWEEKKIKEFMDKDKEEYQRFQ
ncbi:2TM domain-containing protein [Pontimicrobium aquaticum]|uniref:2TM domain-containing protein n=1 Tax=Pontimicrobium aquaticum TaxID=2565367 RepID=A0A4U0EWB2_9FLAO|nr:2TM domain-containing protein [Pontimicrobium aquaticum]TJY36203.1 2TM domain-containing protein [Pontimicrobium aquaticum]